jgi:hypothetical protein
VINLLSSTKINAFLRAQKAFTQKTISAQNAHRFALVAPLNKSAQVAPLEHSSSTLHARMSAQMDIMGKMVPV